MSIDVNWAALTTGPDGLALASTIKDFVHERFQTVALPRFIKSVTVHAFEFGSVPPDLELKDICDPLPDFYEEPSDVDADGSQSSSSESSQPPSPIWERDAGVSNRNSNADLNSPKLPHRRRRPSRPHLTAAPSAPAPGQLPHTRNLGTAGIGISELGSPFLGASTPGFPGGTSNFSYFQSHLAPGRSGTQTPLAAVAGAQGFGQQTGWSGHGGEGAGGRTWTGMGHSRQESGSSSLTGSGIGIGDDGEARVLREEHSISALAGSSATTRPRTQDGIVDDGGGALGSVSGNADASSPPRRFRARRAEDLQTVLRARYAGDVRLSVTAELLLDYPMPSFVGIPVKLNITGLSFDGVAVVAKIRRRAHFCFLSPEDAVAAVGAEAGEPAGPGEGLRMGGLLQDIKVESEIGQRVNGKQVLKNVGKVEKFVLEQVRRIFEDEFVYPSFWTFLV